jgi:dTDP-4-dehydrorhamnose reductase
LKRKLIVIGADGQLGTDLMQELDGRDDLNAVGLTINDVDITDHEQVQKLLTELLPNVVINTAAYHRVDELESNVAKAFQVNVEAVRNLAKVCKELRSTLVHFSTDYVFGGPAASQPHPETDTPCPESVYAVSKLAGEYLIAPYCKQYFVIRTCGLYGHAGSLGKGGNFVETMLKLAAEGKPIRVHPPSCEEAAGACHRRPLWPLSSYERRRLHLVRIREGNFRICRNRGRLITVHVRRVSDSREAPRLFGVGQPGVARCKFQDDA